VPKFTKNLWLSKANLDLKEENTGKTEVAGLPE
jgi:hypothetical protein